jgi:hypothetical protein
MKVDGRDEGGRGKGRGIRTRRVVDARRKTQDARRRTQDTSGAATVQGWSTYSVIFSVLVLTMCSEFRYYDDRLAMNYEDVKLD